MVIDRPRDGQTVFDAFAARARSRSRASLVEQGMPSALGGVAILILAPAWWPIAAMLGASASYAGWGLVDQLTALPGRGVALRALATVATVLSLLAVAGIGLAAFTGDGRSPYGTCYGADGRAFACDARGQPRR